jgi:hypothetical protein
MAARSISDMDTLSAFRANHLGMGGVRSNNCHQQPPMLVDVAQCVEENERAEWANNLPIMVRLRSLDFCNGICGDPVKSMPPKLVIESICRGTDGEHILFIGDLVRGKYQFPHQVIKCGPQVLENVPDDKGNRRWHLGINLHPKADAASLSLFLGHHYAGVSLKVPISFSHKSLSVMLDPDDFLADRFHSQRDSTGDSRG